MAFSPDNKYVVSGSDDFTARVWEATSGKEIARMTYDSEVYAIAFSPDGRFIVSGNGDGIARVWVWKAEDLIAEVCSRLPRNLTHIEWDKYVGESIPYHATCPNLPVPAE